MKANFRNLLNSFAQGDPSVGIDLDEKIKLTPSQKAMKGLTEGLSADPDRFALPQDSGGVTEKFAGGGHDAVTPVMQDTAILSEPAPTPRGMTLDQMPVQPRNYSEPNSTTPTPEQEGYDMGLLPHSASLISMPVKKPDAWKTVATQLANDPDSDVAQLQSQLRSLRSTPIKKEKRWKDVLAYIVQGADAMFNPATGKKIVGYGRIKRDRDIQQVQGQLADAEHASDFNQQRRFKDAQSNRMNAEAYDDYTKPQREKAEQEARIKELQEKNRLEGLQWSAEKINGKIYKKFKDGRIEPLINEQTKQQEVELRDVPIKTVVDGQEVWTIGDKVIDRKIAEEYRQAQMDFEAGKYNTEEMNDYTERVDKWATDTQQANNTIAQLKADGQGKLMEANDLEATIPALSEGSDNPYEDATDNSAKIQAIRAKVAQLRREGASLNRQAMEYKLPAKPTKPKASLSAPRLGVGTYSEADFITKAKAKGITGNNLQRAVEQAKKDGIIK